MPETGNRFVWVLEQALLRRAESQLEARRLARVERMRESADAFDRSIPSRPEAGE